MHLFKEDLIYMSIPNLVNALLDQGLSNSRNSRVCPDYPDKEMLNTGIQRVLGHHVSGRDFLQYLDETDERKTVAKAGLVQIKVTQSLIFPLISPFQHSQTFLSFALIATG